jgi:hypothetical protein
MTKPKLAAQVTSVFVTSKTSVVLSIITPVPAGTSMVVALAIVAAVQDVTPVVCVSLMIPVSPEPSPVKLTAVMSASAMMLPEKL